MSGPFSKEAIADDSAITKMHRERKVSTKLLAIQLISVAVSVISPYVAIKASSQRDEALAVYPSVSRLLYENNFTDVSELHIDIHEDRFAFDALKMKPPEPEDVIAERIEVHCIGSYSLKNDVIVINDTLDCDSEQFIIDTPEGTTTV